MKKECTCSCIAWVLLWCVSSTFSNAQKISRGSFNELYPVRHRYAPVLDSSINVASLSLSARNKLIEKMYEVDQLYRVQLHKPGLRSGSAEQKRYTSLVMINDPVNQAILLKILKRDGWPCDREKGEKSLSYKAWFIVWHDRDSYEGMGRFYPYLEKANASKCINTRLFKQVSDVLNQMRTFRRSFSPLARSHFRCTADRVGVYWLGYLYTY